MKDAERDKTIKNLVTSNNQMAIELEKLQERQLMIEGTSGGGYRTPSEHDDDDDAGKKD